MKRIWITVLIIVMILTACTPRLIPGANLSNKDLRDQTMRDADLHQINFSGADLRNVDLSNTNLSLANLKDADLSGANLSGSNLRFANLSGADLSGAVMSGADFKYTNLSDVDLSSVDLSGAKLGGADLGGFNLSGADLSGAELNGADLSGADLRGADLSGADLSNADLSRADLRGADLSGAKLNGAYLSGVDLSDADLSEADLAEANFENCIGLTLDMVKSVMRFTDKPIHSMKIIHQAYKDVCNGMGNIEAAVYDPATISPLIMSYPSGSAHPESSRLPHAWLPKAIQFTELVVCVGKTSFKHIQTCSFIDDAPDIDRYQPWIPITIRYALTGDELASQIFYGTMPRNCKESEPWNLVRLEGDIEWEPIIDWISEYAQP